MGKDREKTDLLNKVCDATWNADRARKNKVGLAKAERNLADKVVEAAKTGASAHELKEAMFTPLVLSRLERSSQRTQF